jgi:hypothetical protein
MDASIVGALAALLGSMVGGSATIVTTWITLRTQGRRELVTAEIRKRELLYTEFIVECSKLNIDALDHTLDHVETLTQVHALVNRIRLVSTSAVLAAAEAAVKRILKQYVRPNLTVRRFRNWLCPTSTIHSSSSARHADVNCRSCFMPPQVDT